MTKSHTSIDRFFQYQIVVSFKIIIISSNSGQNWASDLL